MIKEGSAKGCLEELIRDRVLRMAWLMQILVDGKVRRFVYAHGEADGVATGDVAILLPAVQLVLLLVVPVHQVFRAASGLSAVLGDAVRGKYPGLRTRCVCGLDEIVDVEGLVREVAAESSTGGHIGACRRP